MKVINLSLNISREENVMTTDKLAFSKSDIKNKKTENQEFIPESFIPGKFNKQGFLYAMGIGIVISIIGISMIGSTKNVSPEVSGVIGFSVSKSVVPTTTADLLIFLSGNLLLLIGLICIFIGIRIFARYLSNRLNR